MKEFLSMGGYAQYVWPSFVLTAVVMLLTLWSARRRRKDALRIAKRRAAEAGR